MKGLDASFLSGLPVYMYNVCDDDDDDDDDDVILVA